MKTTLLSAAAVALAAIAATPAAADTAADLSKCVAALEARGVASSDEYRAKFRGVRGGGATQVAVRFEPTVSGKAPIDAVCTIRRGQVVSLAVDGGEAIALN